MPTRRRRCLRCRSCAVSRAGAPPKARHIEVIDQRALPHALVRVKHRRCRGGGARHPPHVDSRRAADRGGRRLRPGAGAGRDASDAALARAHAALDATRPTAVNLRWALDRVRAAWRRSPPSARADAAWLEADAIVAEDVAINHAIGEHGLALLRGIAQRKPGPVRVMTHCNAGALATCGWGTATAPLFLAHAQGLAAARVGERDTPAPAGCEPDRLGARPARHPPHVAAPTARARR